MYVVDEEQILSKSQKPQNLSSKIPPFNSYFWTAAAAAAILVNT